MGQRLGAFRYSLIVQEIGLGLARSKHGCPRVVFAQRKRIILGKQYFFYCLSAGASMAYFEYNAKKSRTMLKQRLANGTLV